jgi:hypothetical protein
MNKSKGILLYQEEAAPAWILRTIFLIVPVSLVIAAFSLWYSSQNPENLFLLAEGVGIGLALWAVIPRRYQVFEDRLCIVLGGPVTFQIGFDQIASIEITSRTALTLNLVSRIERTYIRIVKKKGFSVAITPENKELFLENANLALNKWKGNNKSSNSYSGYKAS